MSPVSFNTELFYFVFLYKLQTQADKTWSHRRRCFPACCFAACCCATLLKRQRKKNDSNVMILIERRGWRWLKAIGSNKHKHRDRNPSVQPVGRTYEYVMKALSHRSPSEKQALCTACHSDSSVGPWSLGRFALFKIIKKLKKKWNNKAVAFKIK